MGRLSLTLEELLEQCSSALTDHAGLVITKAEDFPVVMEGTFDVEGPAGRLDTFSVRIEFTENFPLAHPRVFETAGRLPHELDRHVFPDGHACLEVWTIWLARSPDWSVRSVLNGPVRNFFLSQSVFEAEERWPFGEYGHGNVGRREAIRDAIGATSIHDRDIFWRVEALISPPGRQHACPCGSGRLFRRCHRDELKDVALRLNEAGIRLITHEYLELLEGASAKQMLADGPPDGCSDPIVEPSEFAKFTRASFPEGLPLRAALLTSAAWASGGR